MSGRWWPAGGRRAWPAGCCSRWRTCVRRRARQTPVAPFLAVSTIFHHTKMPVMNQPDVIAGLVLRLGLSLLFGMVFAIGVTLLRLTQRPLMLLGAGLVYGLALYLVNFQISARAAFPFFVNAKGPTRSSNCGSTPSPTVYCWSRSSSASAPIARRGTDPTVASADPSCGKRTRPACGSAHVWLSGSSV